MRYLFGFAGRIGRLEYFVLSLVLGIVMLLLIALTVGLTRANGGTPSASALAIGLLIAPIFIWFSLALQAKRFRDMGWDPRFAICGWIGVSVLDRLFAFLIPAAASGPGHGTIVGALINLAMVACLWFWPSETGRDNDALTPALRELDRLQSAKAAAPAPIAARNSDWSRPQPSGFGRRTL